MVYSFTEIRESFDWMSFVLYLRVLDKSTCKFDRHRVRKISAGDTFQELRHQSGQIFQYFFKSNIFNCILENFYSWIIKGRYESKFYKCNLKKIIKLLKIHQCHSLFIIKNIFLRIISIEKVEGWKFLGSNTVLEPS